MGGDDDDDGPIELSASSMAALQEFLAEKATLTTPDSDDPDPFK